MIDPVDPNDNSGMLLSLRSRYGSALTVHHTAGLAGFVVSDPDGPGSAAINLDRQDRAALIAVLIELQEVEDLP